MNRKRLFLLFLTGLLSVNLFSTSKKQIDEDCKYLKQYFSQAYVNYDELTILGFDLDAVVDDIKQTYKYNIGFKTPFDKKAFSTITALKITEAVEETGLIDNHLCFKFDTYDSSFFYQTKAYFSGIYFTKEGGEFFVAGSDDDKIKIGQKYTGDIALLKPVFKDGKKLYEIIFLTADQNPEFIINIENKNYQVKARNNNPFSQKEKITFNQNENYLYISLKDCYLDVGNEEKYKVTRQSFENIIDEIINADVNKDIILDLRGNGGGYVEFIYELLVPVFYRIRMEEFPIFNSTLNQAMRGNIKLNSYEIEKAVLRLQDERSIQNKIIPQNISKSYSGLELQKLDYLPQIGNEKFNGNLIILIDSKTASAAEYGVAVSYLFNRDKIILVGDKTYGAISTGDWYSYELPNSGLKIKLSTQNHSQETLFEQNPHWNGDTKGFYPDYWVSNENIWEVVNLLTDNKTLVNE